MEFKEVHSDERRTIHVLNGLLDDKKEFSIITLNPGKAIGGCYHKHDEKFIIIKGEVLIFVGEERIMCNEGYSGTFWAGKAHAFYSKNGATIIEYGITEEEKINSPKDKKMLEEVNRINGS